ncbi:PLC-like phosphodiesterase [Ampelomyces quisqualis]|uniref:PLC-like phosphodiesterase n=1 Tax=Ampelomyces quisqualis TaxID=50730 RepID=A0A6A5QK97_AMPQU|nr:PLC-like phosphodiesterase [Ampelomyces quisqualis]
MFLRNLLRASAVIPFLYTTVTAQTACNNSPDLCSRSYSNITHLGAHDSPFLRNQETGFSTSGNHFYNTTIQLDAGVRMLSAQVHKKNKSGTETLHLCHSSCTLLDAGTLRSWLEEIKAWMDRNTNDVVTVLLVNSDNASPSDLGAQFSASGIDQLAYAPPDASTIPQAWPTLTTLIGNNTRLMTFVASLSTPATEFPYLMNQYAFMFENNFENTDPSNYSCDPSRPTNLGTPAAALQSNRMFLMNHFLYDDSLFGIQITNVTYANVTNAETGLGSLGESLNNCTGVYGKPPSFVMVDWFNMGPAIASVDKANEVTGAVGRTNMGTQALTQGTSGVVRQRGSLLAVVVAVVGAVAFVS